MILRIVVDRKTLKETYREYIEDDTKIDYESLAAILYDRMEAKFRNVEDRGTDGKQSVDHLE